VSNRSRLVFEALPCLALELDHLVAGQIRVGIVRFFGLCRVRIALLSWLQSRRIQRWNLSSSLLVWRLLPVARMEERGESGLW
jgi:hypothetical protein